jgi:methionyl-tRNA formyltransferase
VVFGTSIIRGELLHKGRFGMVNLHGGLSPEYRGSDCTFWALFNREPEKIGCTLHYIDTGIDTGKLIAHVSPTVKQDDNELTLFWRSVKETAAVFAELFERIAGGERLGAPQPSKGRLYQVKQRGLMHEREVDKLLSQGLLRGLNLGLRVKWFHTPSETWGVRR